jgi:hypothetical protein
MPLAKITFILALTTIAKEYGQQQKIWQEQDNNPPALGNFIN